ncbi:MAG: HEAT repeat domain-containing protein, partial [Planctomycetes bacterium]|nr:HEAT repeat domain-containing protein [Planctomycetota bacterium]
QPQYLLQVARQVQEPAVRAGAIRALGRIEDRTLVEDLAEFLRDPSRRVRQAAVEALLSEGERRWSWIRHAVRRALADITLQDDGPLLPRGRLLPSEAVKDLTAWAGEKGILSVRASATLGAHYERALNEQPGEALILEFRRILADPHRPAPLRMELTQLLQKNHLLDRNLQEKLLDPLNPAPLRLLAAEALLSQGAHEGAVAVLRDIARLPNREIGLATAEVIQRRLGVDLGLPVGQPLPAVHTRQAAEVTRRVMAWAMGGEHPEGQGHSGPWARPDTDSSVRSRPVI